MKYPLKVEISIPKAAKGGKSRQRFMSSPSGTKPQNGTGAQIFVSKEKFHFEIYFFHLW